MSGYLTGEPVQLFIEGVGDFPIPSEPNSQIQQLLQNLPDGPGLATYIESWPLIVYEFPQMRHSQSRYFVQYNPQTGTTRRVILHLVRQPVEPSQVRPEHVEVLSELVRSGDIVRLVQASAQLKSAKQIINSTALKFPDAFRWNPQ